MIQQLSGILQDTESIRLDGATSADLLEDILSGVSTLPSSSDVSAIRTATESIYRLENSHLGYLSTLPDIENFNLQQVRLLRALTNLLSRSGGTDVLGGNPWWATNSAFALVQNNYKQVYPDDGLSIPGILSFPQFMSKWSAKLSAPSGSGSLTPLSAYDLWGLGSFRQWGASNQQGFTWFDWVADAMRSNLVLLASLGATTSAPTDVDTDVTAAVDDGSTDTTNVIPDMVVEQMHVTGVESGLELVDSSAVGDMFSSSFTGGDPGFILFSGGRYGDVTVPEVRGSLAIPDGVASYLRGVAKWLWRVALFVGCFIILRQEVAFWSTLGGSASDA